MDLAHECPSGAIRVQRLDGGAQEQPPMVSTVRVRENGPLAFGEPQAGAMDSLARCNGPLDIKPSRDGPLLISGAPEIVSGTGRTVARTRKFSLLQHLMATSRHWRRRLFERCARRDALLQGHPAALP